MDDETIPITWADLKYKFQAATVFAKGQVALSRKVGGMRDDLAVLLQLAVYWTCTGLACASFHVMKNKVFYSKFRPLQCFRAD